MSRMLLSTTSLGGLVTWKPTYTVPSAKIRQTSFPCRIVAIQALEPDNVVPIESILAAPVVSVTALAPDMLMAVA